MEWVIGMPESLIGMHQNQQHFVHPFRRMSSTDSDSFCPPIPTHFVHLDAPSVRRTQAGREGCWITGCREAFPSASREIL